MIQENVLHTQNMFTTPMKNFLESLKASGFHKNIEYKSVGGPRAARYGVSTSVITRFRENLCHIYGFPCSVLPVSRSERESLDGIFLNEVGLNLIQSDSPRKISGHV